MSWWIQKILKSLENFIKKISNAVCSIFLNWNYTCVYFFYTFYAYSWDSYMQYTHNHTHTHARECTRVSACVRACVRVCVYVCVYLMYCWTGIEWINEMKLKYLINCIKKTFQVSHYCFHCFNTGDYIAQVFGDCKYNHVVNGLIACSYQLYNSYLKNNID
jgi:hypothetical protein